MSIANLINIDLFNQKICCLTGIIALSFLIQPTFGQHLPMEKITISDGLSQGMIFDVLQTKDGFLWIATKDGLNRYDGYNFKIFSNDPFDPNSISENTVTALFEDTRGLLWVGLQNKGIDLYDPESGTFFHYPFDFIENTSHLDLAITKINESKDGSIWALTSGSGLLHLSAAAIQDRKQVTSEDNPISCRFELLALPQPINPPQPEMQEVFKNLELRSTGDLLVFSDKTIYAVNSKTHSAKVLDGFHSEKTILHSYLTEFQGREIIWLARAGDRANNSKADLVRIIDGEPQVFQIPKEKWGLWMRLFPGKNGHVEMVVGKNFWDLSPGEIPDFGSPDYLLDEVPTTWVSDRSGNVWAGTTGYGLRKSNHLQGLFNASANNWSISGIWAFGEEYYVKWINSIRHLDLATGLISDHSAFLDAPEIQVSMAIEPSGAVWLLAASEDKQLGQALFKYAPGSQGPAERIFEFNAKVSLRDPFMLSSSGKLWTATHGGELVRFDTQTGQFDYYEVGNLFGEDASSLVPVALAEDKEGVIWLGTILGLVKGTPSGRGYNFSLLQAGPDKPQGLNNNSIACIFPDNDGLIWLGTKGGGINVMEAATGYCHRITIENGLLDNVVYGILKSNPNEYWCSTNRGLAKIIVNGRNPFTFKVTTYTSELGLQDNEFNTQAFFRKEDGELLFGGVNGINRFYPDQFPKDTLPPPVFVVGIEINHQKAGLETLGCPPEKLKRLELGYDQNNLSFEFAALDFTAPSKNRYRYRLIGLDDDWVETGNHRFAHFNHLSPGEYQFLVEGNNGESNWAGAPHAIHIVVFPPWWRSNLAYLLYAIFLFWAAWMAYRFQIRRIKEREQLAFEQREKERIRASEQMKTNFFNSITHEFRTPLTLIIEPLRQLLRKSNNPENNQKINLAITNSERLLRLVNQLLRTAKLQSGSLTLHYQMGDLAATLERMLKQFQPVAEKKGVNLKFKEDHTGLPFFEFDQSNVEIILTNLLSNALKFTHKGGNVFLAVEWDVIPTGQDELVLPGVTKYVAVSVSDSGIGISDEMQQKVFDRYFQVEEHAMKVEEGSGIGLALSKELAELMGGTITLKSEQSKGSEFTFWLPIRGRKNKYIGVVQDENFDPDKQSDAGVKRERIVSEERPLVLLVEDNAELREFIRQSLENEFEIVEAVNGNEGVQKAIELVPELIISDVMMPEKDGYQLCDELKTNELTSHIPIILLTAKSALNSKLKGLRNGADDYVTKPFHTEELLARMENLITMRRLLRQKYSHLSRSETAQYVEFLSKHDNDFLRRFHQIIEDRMADEQLSVEKISELLFVSRSQLFRKIKAITDISPIEYLRNFRLDKAMDLLRSKEGNISQVALMVGFTDEKYFSKRFKERFGLSPSAVN